MTGSVAIALESRCVGLAASVNQRRAVGYRLPLAADTRYSLRAGIFWPAGE